MSSTYLRAQEDGKRKRAQTREQLRIKFAGEALSGLIASGNSDPESLAVSCVAIADALVRRLGYAKEVKPSDLTEEEKEPLD